MPTQHYLILLIPLGELKLQKGSLIFCTLSVYSNSKYLECHQKRKQWRLMCRSSRAIRCSSSVEHMSCISSSIGVHQIACWKSSEALDSIARDLVEQDGTFQWRKQMIAPRGSTECGPNSHSESPSVPGRSNRIKRMYLVHPRRKACQSPPSR